MKKLYFAHPVNTYGQPIESDLVEFIRLSFQDWDIENPNQKKHQDGYADFKKRTGNGMNYFFDEVLPSMDGVIGMPFLDGKIGAGVFGEEENIFKRTGNLWTITHNKVLSGINDVFVLKPFALTPDETRPRVYIDGKRENGMKDYFDKA